ncbi:MAG: 2-phospho-L-lactate guanylyltransferase [Sphingomonadales bacterium]|nr:2-phospho-L-lactate guanylyltransferase [Sphingomonadales bacterium]
MNWTAIVPVKRGGARKSRLAKHLSPEQRNELSDILVARVLESLDAAPSVTSIVVLSESPHDDARLGWHPDLGRGLNVELSAFAAAAGIRRLLIIHGDLPLLTGDDVEALISAATRHGIAIAPDRHGQGTNALAFRDEESFDFAFGNDSCNLHRQASGHKAVIVDRAGLSVDIDTHDDLLFAHAAGFSWPRS